MAREAKTEQRTRELFEFDTKFDCLVVGCDEAGRGPLAGPVVCAACIMPMDEMICGIDDSKNISETKREQLFEQIIKRAISFKVAVVDTQTIDQINILNATKRGMSEAIGQAVGKNDNALVLVDAVKLDMNLNTMPIIKGDAKSYNIAAASIIAKVTRDRMMRSLDKIHPDYGFCKNKGYGTKDHIDAIKKHGACEAHRSTFIKNFLPKE